MESVEYTEYTEPVDDTEALEAYDDDAPVNELRYSALSDYAWALIAVVIIIVIFVIQQPGKMMHWMLLH